jgi:CRISPR/Cas system CSM-associated protein Csm3 (group 7 of RAMP superfamily)
MKRVEGKVVFKGIIENTSPMVIGTGEGEYSNLEVIKGYDGSPYIPASSLVGVMSHHFSSKRSGIGKLPHLTSLTKEEEDYFWGSMGVPGSDDSGIQSHLMLDDLLPINTPKVVIRDGVAIDPAKGIAKDKAKYDYEIVEPGAAFSLSGEVTIREGFKREVILAIVKWLILELANGNISAGAMTTKGMGRIKLRDFAVFGFQFPSDGQLWLEFIESRNNYQLIESQKMDIDKSNHEAVSKNDLVIEAEFTLKGSLIIGSYSSDPEKPDKSHIGSNGKPVLTGTSIKGAIRDRATKILNTLGVKGEEKLKKTFGWAETDRESKEKYKSRLVVEESSLEGVESHIQPRVKIDRFTGGTVGSALFDSEPVWHKSENAKIKLRINDCEEWEAGLILLVLKDLWTSDLPIGGEKNVGRGLLKGKQALIRFNGDEFMLKGEEELQMSDAKGNAIDATKLDLYVNSLFKELEVPHEQNI